MAKILVTGAAGYIGSILTPELLKEDHEVIALDNFMYNQTSLLDCIYDKNLAIVRGDARNENLISKYIKDDDFIIPLACIVGAPACDKDLEVARSTNLEAIKMILKLREPNQKIIFPQNTTNIIFDILKNYGLDESQEQRFAKRKNGLKTNGAIIGGLIAQTAAKKISLNDLSLQIKTSFGLNQKLASDLTRTIKTMLLDLCRYEEEVEEIETTASPRQSNHSETIEQKESEKKSTPDLYREPVI